MRRTEPERGRGGSTAPELSEGTRGGLRPRKPGSGDDDITKPFHTEELLLRIEAVLGRTRPFLDGRTGEASITIGRYKFDPQARSLELEGTRETLTQKESDLLHVLARSLNQVLEGDTAMRAVWGSGGYFVGRRA